MFNLTDQQKNVLWNYTEIPCHPIQNGNLEEMRVGAGEGADKREQLSTAESVSQSSHNGSQYAAPSRTGKQLYLSLVVT